MITTSHTNHSTQKTQLLKLTAFRIKFERQKVKDNANIETAKILISPEYKSQ